MDGQLTVGKLIELLADQPLDALVYVCGDTTDEPIYMLERCDEDHNNQPSVALW